MELNIVKINPTENMTILVKDNVAREYHPKIAEHLMQYSSVHAEQVGYIESPEDPCAVARLQMMGGEFCANATLSLAAYLVSQQPNKLGHTESIILEVSGLNKLIECQISVQASDYLGRIKMPELLGIREMTLSINQLDLAIQQVALPGINHYLFDKKVLTRLIPSGSEASEPQDYQDKDAATALKKESKLLEDYAAQALEQLSSRDTGEAFGMLFVDRAQQQFIPAIYVKKTNTLIWERSCISGTAALAYADLLTRDHPTLPYEISYQQPGGQVVAEITAQQELYIRANIKIVLEGKVYLDPIFLE